MNPGQDFDDLEANAYNPEKDLSRPVVSPTHVRTGSSLEPEEAAREGKQITTTPFAPLELPIGEETIADGVQPGSDTTAGSHLATTPSPGEHTNTRATGARQIDSNAAVDSRSSTLGKDANRLSSNSRPGTGGRDAIQSRGSTVHDRTTVV